MSRMIDAEFQYIREKAHKRFSWRKVGKERVDGVENDFHDKLKGPTASQEA